MTWYALRTRPLGMKPAKGQARWRIELALEQMGVEYWLPREMWECRHRKTGQLVTRYRALIPGHVFVTGSLNFQAIEDNRWVSSFVRGASRQLLVIQEREIERLRGSEMVLAGDFQRKRQEREMNKETLAKLYPAGTKVTIKSGPFAGMEATISSATARRTVKAMINLLGSEIEAEMDYKHVEKEATA
jgi:transcription antitermination factor NusG